MILKNATLAYTFGNTTHLAPRFRPLLYIDFSLMESITTSMNVDLNVASVEGMSVLACIAKPEVDNLASDAPAGDAIASTEGTCDA